jgi:hypothetical protein
MKKVKIRGPQPQSIHINTKIESPQKQQQTSTATTFRTTATRRSQSQDSISFPSTRNQEAPTSYLTIKREIKLQTETFTLVTSQNSLIRRQISHRAGTMELKTDQLHRASTPIRIKGSDRGLSTSIWAKKRER